MTPFPCSSASLLKRLPSLFEIALEITDHSYIDEYEHDKLLPSLFLEILLLR